MLKGNSVANVLHSRHNSVSQGYSVGQVLFKKKKNSARGTQNSRTVSYVLVLISLRSETSAHILPHSYHIWKYKGPIFHWCRKEPQNQPWGEVLERAEWSHLPFETKIVGSSKRKL